MPRRHCCGPEDPPYDRETERCYSACRTLMKEGTESLDIVRKLLKKRRLGLVVEVVQDIQYDQSSDQREFTKKKVQQSNIVDNYARRNISPTLVAHVRDGSGNADDQRPSASRSAEVRRSQDVTRKDRDPQSFLTDRIHLSSSVGCGRATRMVGLVEDWAALGHRSDE